MQAYEQDGWWGRAKAAEYLGMSPGTLANWACRGTGPRFKRISGGKRGGAVRYRKEWLDDYVMSSGSPVRLL